MKHKSLIFILLFFVLSGCARIIEKPPAPAPVKPRPARPVEIPPTPVKAQEALVRVDANTLPPIFSGVDKLPLEIAVLKSIGFYERSSGRSFRFGSDTYSADHLRQSLLRFLDILRDSDPPESKERRVRESFLAYKSVGRPGKGTVLFTGYFEPVLNASQTRTESFNWPIYMTPDDLITVDLSRFRDKYRGERIVGRVEKQALVPYYNRCEIDRDGRLAERGLEIAWFADPVDVFNLHIQGSGMICYPDRDCIQVSYANANGRSYRSIGRYLQDAGKVSEQEMSYQSINKYLREHPEELSDILCQNESYVFFRIVPQGPVGGLGVPLTAGCSIATDPVYFPKGALALVKTRRPVFDDSGKLLRWIEFSRAVLNQDAGGAIKGPGRVDIFFGTGSQAELEAGGMKEEGELYFLVMKK